MFDNLYLHFSALETALLPYFLFVVYGVIVLVVKSELAGRTYVKPIAVDNQTASVADETIPSAVELATDDVSAIDSEESATEVPQEYVLSVPCPANVDLVAVEFGSEVRTRSSKKRRAKAMSELIALEFEQTASSSQVEIN
jgi:hypothetical protein